MIPIPPQALKYGGIALAVLSVFWFGYYKGHSAVQERFDAYKAEVAAIAAAQEEKTRNIEAKNKKLTEDTRNAYNTQLAALRAYYGMRNNGSGTMPKVSGSAGGVDGYTFDSLPPATVLAGQCAETTLNLIALQGWVRGVVNNGE